MQTTLQKWGNSQGIRIPKHMITDLNMQENDIFNIQLDNEKIILTKIESQKRKNIKELFEGYTEDYQAENIDCGEPVGREIW